MAKYPKITDNNATNVGTNRFNRLINSNFAPLPGASAEGVNGGFLIKKLTDVNNKEFIYSVIIIESNGTAGSELDLSAIQIRNAAGAISGDGSVLDAPNQGALFCVSPKKNTAEGVWANSTPFMGLTDSSYANTQVYTHDLLTTTTATGAGANNTVRAASKNAAEGANAFLKVKFDTDGTVRLVTADTPEANCDAFIPIYDHAYVVANNIPSGSYAAILIKCDLTVSGIFDGESLESLEINHNGIDTTTDTASDYSISLKVTGQNIFESQVLLNSSEIADGGTTAPLISRMMPVHTNPWTGLSWRTDNANDTNSVYSSFIVTNSTDTVAPQSSSSGFLTAAESSEYFALHPLGGSVDGHTSAHRTHLFGTNDTVRMFSAYKLVARDSSVIPEDADVTIKSTGTSILFSSADTPPSTNATQTSKYTDFEYPFTHGLNSVLASSGTHKKLSNAYSNFSPDSIKETQAGNVLMIPSDLKEDVTNFSIPYIVYPLFTYPTSTTDLEPLSAANATSNSVSIPSADVNQFYHEHANTAYTQFEAFTNGFNSVRSTAVSNKTIGEESVDLISYHNLRINCLHTDDVLNNNGLATYAPTGAARLSTSGSIVKDGETVVSTKTPSVAEASLDYTITDVESIQSDYVANNLHHARTPAGGYSNVHATLGYKTSVKTFSAPVTAWVPGKENGVLTGNDLIPYAYSEGPGTSSLSLNLGYYDSRPLLHVGYKANTCSLTSINRLEFLSNGSATVSGTTDGVYDFDQDAATAVIGREVSNLFKSALNSDLIEHLAGAAVTKTSYQPGMEIFGLDLVPGFTLPQYFVSEVIPGTADSDGNRTKLRITNNNGGFVAPFAASSSFSVSIGKPTVHPASRNTSFVHSATASYEERDRVNFAYGSDLSWRIKNTSLDYITPLDNVFIESTGGTNADLVLVQPGTLATANNVFIANAALTSASTQSDSVSIYNFAPVEVGLLLDNTPLVSRRLVSNSSQFDQDIKNGNRAPMFYKSLNNTNFSGGSFSGSMELYPFNEGNEDIHLIDVELFDPYYLPEGVFEAKPHGSNAPTWSIVNLSQIDGVTTNYGASSAGHSTTALTGTSELFGAAPNKLQRYAVETTNEGANAHSAVVSQVSFSQATNGFVAGDYYKAIEFSYYRDIAATQMRPGLDSYSSREFGDRPVWKTRKLIKVSINSVSGITISDADNSSVTINDNINFGIIQA